MANELVASSACSCLTASNKPATHRGMMPGASDIPSIVCVFPVHQNIQNHEVVSIHLHVPNTYPSADLSSANTN